MSQFDTIFAIFLHLKCLFKDQRNTEILLGVMSAGIVVYKNRVRINYFPWWVYYTPTRPASACRDHWGVKWDKPCSTAYCQLKLLRCPSRIPLILQCVFKQKDTFKIKNVNKKKKMMKNSFCRLKAQSSLIIPASLAVLLAAVCGCRTGFSLILLISFC